MSTSHASLTPSGALLKIGGKATEDCYLNSDGEYYVDLCPGEEILRHGISVVPPGSWSVRVMSGDILTRRVRD